MAKPKRHLNKEQMRAQDCYICICPMCDFRFDIYTDELEKPHDCPKCGAKLECSEIPVFLYETPRLTC